MGDIYDPLTAVNAAGNLVKVIVSKGLSVEVEHDFAQLEKLCEEIDGKTLSEQFSPSFFDIAPSIGFWLSVRDATGKLVSVQAARIENLHGRSLGDHWNQQQRRIYVDRADEGALGTEHAPGADLITGNVVYHGDMWLSDDLRGGGVASTLCRLGQMVAYMKWQPDFIYCFMSEALVRKGFSTGQGYFHMQPCGTDWQQAPADIRPDDWLLWNSRTDLHYLARILAQSA